MKEKKTICDLNHKQIRYEVCPDLQQDPAALLFFQWSLQDLFAKSICPISDTSQSRPSSHKPSKCQNGKSQISLTWLPGSLAKARGGGAKGIPLTLAR